MLYEVITGDAVAHQLVRAGAADPLDAEGEGGVLQNGKMAEIEDLGHLSVLEHASFSFGIEGISRACSHQLVRHRLASYSQQSQRYVSHKERFTASYNFV